MGLKIWCKVLATMVKRMRLKVTFFACLVCYLLLLKVHMDVILSLKLKIKTYTTTMIKLASCIQLLQVFLRIWKQALNFSINFYILVHTHTTPVTDKNVPNLTLTIII